MHSVTNNNQFISPGTQHSHPMRYSAFPYLFFGLFLSGFFKVYAQQMEYLPLINVDTEIIKEQMDKTYTFRDIFPDSVLSVYEKTGPDSQSLSYRSRVLRSYIGSCYLALKKGDHDSAIYFSTQALLFADTQAHRKELAILFNCLGVAYERKILFNKAFEMYLKAAHFATEQSNLASVYNNMAGVLRVLQQPQKAMAYINAALPMAKRNGNHALMAGLFTNKGLLYKDLKMTSESNIYFDSAVHIASSFQLYSPLSIAVANRALGYIRNNQVRMAIDLLQENLSLLDKPSVMAKEKFALLSMMGTALQQAGQYTNAEKYFMEAKQYASPRDKMNLYELLIKNYEQKGAYKNALTLYKEYKSLDDSIRHLDIQHKIHELDIKYRTGEKDKKIIRDELRLSKQENRIAHKNILLIIIIGTASVIILILVFRQAYMHQKNIRLKKEKENVRLKALIDGVETERSRVALELHDGIGSLLSAAKMNISSMTLTETQNTQKYNRGVQLLDDAYRELRRAAHNLSPEILQAKGLIEATRIFCEKICQDNDLQVKFQHAGNFSHLPDAVVLAAYRIIQEWLHNVVKHSQAHEVLVQLSKGKDSLNITIEDNGVGMLENASGDGIGLRNLKARVEALNGSLQIDSRPHIGTTFYVIIDYEF